MLVFTGETVEIVANINNSSSRDMTPKFSLMQFVEFHAQGDTKHQSFDVEKVVDHPIKPKTQQQVKCAIKIPNNQMSSIPNCEIITVEYKLKVCNNIKLSTITKIYVHISHILTLFYANLSKIVNLHETSVFSSRCIWTSALPLIQRSSYQCSLFLLIALLVLRIIL